jgi:hypothetical protein
VLLLLRSEGGLLKAIAFVGGQTLFRLAQGTVFGFVLNSSLAAQTEQGSSLIVSSIVLVLGILLWVTALAKWLKAPDPDAPPPKWMAMFSSISAGKAFLLSFLLMALAAKQWIFTLGALGVINQADLPGPQDAIAFLIFVLGAQALVLVPIIMRAVIPSRSAALLEAGYQWLERNNRTIVIAVSSIFGTYFIFKGITGLLGG